MSIGERIKAARERKVLGQSELARKAGLAVNTVWHIEAGHHKPRPATIRKIAAALDIEPGELVKPD